MVQSTGGAAFSRAPLGLLENVAILTLQPSGVLRVVFYRRVLFGAFGSILCADECSGTLLGEIFVTFVHIRLQKWLRGH